jgi:hypothetical protein
MTHSLRFTRLFRFFFVKHFSLSLFLSLFALCSIAFIVHAGGTGPLYIQQQQPEVAMQCPTCKPPTEQIIYAPLFDVPEASSSEIVLNCRSIHVVDLTPTFYTLDGTSIVGDVIHLQPAEMRFVETKSLIPVSQRDQHRWGGISFSFMGNTLEAWAQITLHGIRGGGSANILFTVLSQPRPYTSEAVWWIPRGGSALIALGNSSAQPVHANLNFSEGVSRSIDIAPFATEIIRPRSQELSLLAQNRGKGEAVTINYTGAAGSLIPTGFVSSSDGKFTSLIRFYNTPGVVQPDLFATNLRLKDSQPHLILRNTSSGSITARPKFLTSTGIDVETFKLSPIKLAPYEVTEVNLKPLMAAADSRADLETVSVHVANSGAAGSLVGALYSTNMKTGVTYDVPLRDSGPPNASAGAYPVRLDGDYTTVLSITNVGKKPGRFSLQINYQGGAYVLDAISVNQGQTKTYDIRKLRDEQTLDREGNPFPLAMETGQIRWSMLGDGSTRMTGRAEVVSIRDGVSSSYSCGICCPYSHFDGWIIPSVTSGLIGGTMQFTAKERQRDCYGNLFGPYNAGVVDSWWSDDATVATVSYNGLGTGVGSGTTSVWASWTTDTWMEDLNSMCEDTQGTEMQAGDMTVRPSVVISGPTSVVLDTSGEPGVNKSIQLIGTGNPSGGTFSWSTNSSNVTLSNTSSDTVTVTSANASSARNDVTITLVYAVNGQGNSATKQITVVKPTFIKFESQSTDPTGRNCGTYNSYLTQRFYSVWDQFSPAGQITGVNYFINESFSNRSTTCPPYVGVVGGGIYQVLAPDSFSYCNDNCRNGGSCVQSADQSITVNGFPVSISIGGTLYPRNSVTWTCSSVIVVGTN